jgi:Na+/melibiose symporter-like transporter
VIFSFLKFAQSKFFVYIGLAVVLLGIGWGIYNKGYNAGYDEQQDAIDSQIAKTLTEVVYIERKVAESDLEAVTVNATRKAEIRYEILKVDRVIDTCNRDQQLQFFNDIVRAIQYSPSTGRVNSAP